MEVVQSIGVPLDAGFRGLRFQEVESVIRAVRTWLREQEMSWCREDMNTLVTRRRKAVDVDGKKKKNYYV
jgi:hypothetical protein